MLKAMQIWACGQYFNELNLKQHARADLCACFGTLVDTHFAFGVKLPTGVFVFNLVLQCAHLQQLQQKLQGQD